MRFTSPVRYLRSQPAVIATGRGIFCMAAIAVISSSSMQLPAYAQSISAGNAGSEARPAVPSQQGTIDIEFEEAPVADILNTVAEMSKVNIIVNSDVDARLRNVKLHDYTVEEAIQLVCKAANLSWSKQQRAYIISKMPASGGGISISPSTSDVASPPFAMPGSITGNGSLSVSNALMSLGIPDISGSGGNGSKEKITREFRLRNVKPSLMAFWLDPARHAEPIEYKQAHERQANTNEISNPHSMQEDAEARSDERKAQLGKTYGQWQLPVGAPNGYLPFANPYANPYGGFPALDTRSYNQFGGGGGTSGGGGNRSGNSGGGNNGGGSGGGLGGSLNSADGSIPLPPGIDNIIVVDAQNAILVQGTGEGIEQIENIITFLDRPVQQVEIEAQFVSLTEGASRALGLDFTRGTGFGRGFFADTNPLGGNNTGQGTNTTSPGNVLIGYVGKNFTATLNALVSRDLAKIVNSPRITTFNNLTAQLRSVTTRRILTLQTNITNPGGGNTPTQTTTQIITPITTGVVLTVTPTIHRDGTITMAIQPIVSSVTPNAASPFPDVNQQEISTVSNVKDGDTLAIGGLRTKTASEANRKVPFLGNIPLLGPLLFRSKSRILQEQELIIFLTARIVRRTDDPIPGA